jgi:hypothetical protein
MVLRGYALVLLTTAAFRIPTWPCRAIPICQVHGLLCHGKAHYRAPVSPRFASHGADRLDSARLGSTRFDSVRLGSSRLVSTRLGSARLVSSRLDSTRLGSARLGSARLLTQLAVHLDRVKDSGSPPREVKAAKFRGPQKVWQPLFQVLTS